MPLDLLFQKMTFATKSSHSTLRATPSPLQRLAGLRWLELMYHGSAQQPALGGRLMAPKMAERTTVTPKLYIFSVYVAKISFPACAVLCCF